MAKAKKIGRPSSYTDALAAEICERLSKGEPLAVICRDDHMPDPSTVHRWQQGNETLSQSIARAREAGFDAIAADCLLIADGKDERAEADLPAEADAAVIVRDHNRDRLRVDTRLKLLAKWDPKRYGDKVALTGGSEGDAPLKAELTVKLVRSGN